ncbi:MAG: PadR family transcriptional regulator [Solirubrobacteraceae bacterium]
MRSESLKGHLDALILAIVSGGPQHGYAIIEELRCRSGGAMTLPEGTVYPALHRLEASGLLSSSWSLQAGRRRRVYELTRRGVRELGARRDEWREFASAVEAVLAPGDPSGPRVVPA